MRQVVQSFRSGELTVADVPPASVRKGGLLVAVVRSLISAGTEKSTVDVARKSLLGKAMDKPEVVRKVIAKARRDGIQDTVKMVFQRLDSPVALGYSCAGIVVDVGDGVQGFAVGDRVACAGFGYASHAELVYVPQNLCAKIPDGLAFDDAAYVTLGAIAMQGVRQADPRLGETVAVIGLGLLGQLTVQILKASGCRVVATDIAADKLAMAQSLGADSAVPAHDLVTAVRSLTDGHGADAVIVTASTRDNGPVELAGEACRKKGRVVIVGAVGMHLPREPYYKKELELRLSTSYGPGRYDTEYEEKGHDYPYAYVRWTENRNMESFLWLLASGKVQTAPLTTHRLSIETADAGYRMMLEGTEPYLGILLTYADPVLPFSRPPVVKPASRSAASIELGVIGAGNHVKDMLLPHVTAWPGVKVRWICQATAVSADALGRKLGVEGRTTDFRDVLADPAVNTVLIGTRHGSHAPLVLEALRAGKHVFVEKPLCLTEDELEQISAEYPRAAEAGQRLMVGFNRRFSAHARQVRDFYTDRHEPLVMAYRVNAGAVPADHWVQDDAEGGGRIIGEGCHFIDLMQFICGAVPRQVQAHAIGRHSTGITSDHSVLTVRFADGSVGTLIYAAGGDSALPKERLEVFGDGRAAVLDDFFRTTLARNGKSREFRTSRRDKGFAEEINAFLTEVKAGGAVAMPFNEITAVTRACILLDRSLRTSESYEF